jgi:hypothetical protein
MPLSAVLNGMILVSCMSAILCLATTNKLLKSILLNGAVMLSLKQLELSKLLSVLNGMLSGRNPISIWSIFMRKEMCLRLLLIALLRMTRRRRIMAI